MKDVRKGERKAKMERRGDKQTEKKHRQMDNINSYTK